MVARLSLLDCDFSDEFGEEERHYEYFGLFELE